MENLLTLPESATELRLKLSTLYKWIRLGKLPCVRMGRKILVRRQDLDALIAQSFVPARKKSQSVLEPARARLAVNEVNGASSQPKNSPPPPTPLPQRERGDSPSNKGAGQSRRA